MFQFSRRLGAASIGALLVLSAYSHQPSLAQGPARTTVALTGARVIDGTGQPPLEQATIVVVNGRIESVGTGAAVKIPSGATRVNLAGKTVLPGMINAHAHSNNGDEKLPLHDQLVQQLRLYAQYGVTSIVTLGDDGRESVKVHDENASPSLDRARLFSAGPPVVARNVEEARQLVNANADLGVHFIKTRMNGVPSDMTPEVFAAVIDQAHKRGLRVACHLYYQQEAMGMVNAGLDVIGHSIRDQDVDKAFVAELKRRDVSYIPTLTRDLAVFVYESTPAFLSDPFFLKGVTFTRGQLDQVKDPAYQQRIAKSPEAQAIKKALDQASRNVKILSDGGIRIAMGTDSGTQVGRWQGYFEHVELELMVKAGLTPMQALVAATSGAATAMKLEGLGAIQAGKQADFLVLNADPLADIKNTRQIHSVWIGGRRLGAAVGTN